jgi:hypothetical protein
MHFIFNKCTIYTHDGTSAKFRTNLQEADYSVDVVLRCMCDGEASFFCVHNSGLGSLH